MSSPLDPYETYIEELKEARRKARRAPLKNGHVLRPHRRASFDYQTILGIPSHAHPASGSKGTTGDLRLLATMEQHGLNLVRALSSQTEETWSQVCVATLASPRVTRSSSPELVVKLFQESLFPEQDEDLVLAGEHRTGKRLSHRKNWAFNALHDLQGRVIPRFYGFYDFELPCGELVCGHVMEFVRGKTLERDWKSMDDPSWKRRAAAKIRSQRMKTFMDSLQEIHRRGVLHGDLRKGNVIVPDTRPDQCVFIDFACAKMLTPGKGRLAVRTEKDLGGALACLQCIEECGAVSTWIGTHGDDAEWREMFGWFPPSELAAPIYVRDAVDEEKAMRMTYEHPSIFGAM